ncbi:hypothetical protein GA0115253_1032210 [Streptomyces sp. Termitarium-T10T-6]|nr:hypothetical protein GA0115253_1032210 [Streptomyces sp. Termitarium-T10T-6]
MAYRSSGGVICRGARPGVADWPGTLPAVVPAGVVLSEAVLSGVVVVSFVIGGGPSGWRGC